LLKHSYWVEFRFKGEISLKILFDGKNYLNLYPSSQAYLLEDSKFHLINKYRGNFYAIREMLFFLKRQDSIKYSINNDLKNRSINIEFTLPCTYVFWEIPLN
jgi:hypothetical protein